MHNKEDEFFLKKLIYCDDSEDDEEANKSHIQGMLLVEKWSSLAASLLSETCNTKSCQLHQF